MSDAVECDMRTYVDVAYADALSWGSPTANRLAATAGEHTNSPHQCDASKHRDDVSSRVHGGADMAPFQTAGWGRRMPTSSAHARTLVGAGTQTQSTKQGATCAAAPEH